jgi:hypothetical protein
VRSVRLLLCLLFAFLAAVTLFLMVAMLFPAWQASYKWHGGSRLVGILGYELLLLPFATVYGMAWWTVFMHLRRARAWAIAASIVLLIMFSILLAKQSLVGIGCGAIFGVGGTLGLFAFARSSTIFEHQESCDD